MSADAAATAALLKYREPKYSESQVHLMLHTALMIKDHAPDRNHSEIVMTTMDLHNMAIEAGKKAGLVDVDESPDRDSTI